MTIVDGRQLAPTLAGIRADHVNRYKWAREYLRDQADKVVDLGCGCGYGAAILAGGPGREILAIDSGKKAIDYAKEHYSAEGITYRQSRAESARLGSPDAIVAFEVIEHIEDAPKLLAKLAKAAPVLLGSVPNEAVIPHDKARNPQHFRHYTAAEITAALFDAGFETVAMHGQLTKRGQRSAVSQMDGNARKLEACRTLVFAARRPKN